MSGQLVALTFEYFDLSCSIFGLFLRVLALISSGFGEKMVTKGSDASKDKQKDNKDNSAATGGFNPIVFVQESREELKKVVWPDRQRLIGESAAVILMVALSAVTISLVDQLFSWLAKTIFA
jgi:preprotein translocase subunit SecE